MNTCKPLAVGIFAALTSACMVGPNFQRPAPPRTERFTAGVQPLARDGGAHRRRIEGIVRRDGTEGESGIVVDDAIAHVAVM